MNKLSNTAKKLDIFFKALNILLAIAAVILLVGTVFAAAFFLFDLPVETVDTASNVISFDFLELTISDAYAPDARQILAIAGVACILATVVCYITRLCVKCIRQILAPMIENQPFNTTVSDNLKKLAKYTLILGITVIAIEWITTGMMVGIFDLPALLISERITHVSFTFSTDLTFLIVSAVFLLLSYIFRYGEELQQLSDETL